MKLTISDRDAFVRSVMDDVPKVNYDLQLIQAINEEVLAQAPAKLVAIAKDKTLKHLLNRSLYTKIGRWSGYIYDIPFNASDALVARVNELYSLREGQTKTRSELRQKVEGVIKACSTLKQAKERLPEFEKYLPLNRDGGGTANLPVIANVVADLSKAGVAEGWEEVKFGPVISGTKTANMSMFDSKTHRLVVDFVRDEMRLFKKATKRGKPFLETMKVVRIEEIEV